jgi:predicted metal-dependent HD superfamily phosphohydrolase
LEKVLRILKIDYSQGYLARQNVYAALFFHDAVYIPGFPENEVLSAKLARSCLTKLGVNENYICDIERYILATRHDHAPEKEDEWLVTDIDLSSLAVPWEVFKGNAEKLAREHRAVCSRGEFIYGQKIFLKRFLARKIFGTYHFTKYEDLAKENIGRFMYVI